MDTAFIKLKLLEELALLVWDSGGLGGTLNALSNAALKSKKEM